MKRALVSVSDKTNLVPFVKGLWNAVMKLFQLAEPRRL